MKIRLVNHTSDRQLFRFAVETIDGLDDWKSHEVTATSTESVIRDLSETGNPTAIHGVVDDYLTSKELGEGGRAGSDETCPYILFEYGYVDDPPSFLVHTDVGCDW